MRKDPLKLIAAAIATLYFLWCASDLGQWHLIDGVNLVIHEAGHLIFRPFGEFMMIAGGSLFQVIMPSLFVGYFCYQRQFYSAAVVLFWVGESILNVSVYAGDAAAKQLPLLGGENSIHDWNYLLSSMNLLQNTAEIAGAIRLLGTIAIVAAGIGSFMFATKEGTVDQEPETTDLIARVFAYGSNMCSARFRDYGMHPRKIGVGAVLRHHRLCFNKRSRDDSGKANLEPDEGTDVWGVLYEIPEHELAGLRRREVGYTPRSMPVEITPGLTLEAWVFFAVKPEPNVLHPYSWYLRFLVEGAIEHHLGNEYIEMLRGIHATEDDDHGRDLEKHGLPCS